MPRAQFANAELWEELWLREAEDSKFRPFGEFSGDWRVHCAREAESSEESDAVERTRSREELGFGVSNF